MIYLEEIDGKGYELRWLEAERQLALLEYEHYVRFHEKLNDADTPGADEGDK